MKYLKTIKMGIFLPFVYSLFLFGTAFVVNADNHDTGGGDGDGCDESTSLCNPLKATDIVDFILDVIDVLLIFAVPIIILFIMYAGFLFVTARGNESQITKAKSALLWAIVGGVIALGAKLIIEVIRGTIDAFGA